MEGTFGKLSVMRLDQQQQFSFLYTLSFVLQCSQCHLEGSREGQGVYNTLTLTFARRRGGHQGGHLGGQTVVSGANGTRSVIGEKLSTCKVSVNSGHVLKLQLYHILHSNDTRLIYSSKLLTHIYLKKMFKWEQFQFNYFPRLKLGRGNDLCLNISMTDELSQE